MSKPERTANWDSTTPLSDPELDIIERWATNLGSQLDVDDRSHMPAVRVLRAVHDVRSLRSINTLLLAACEAFARSVEMPYNHVKAQRQRNEAHRHACELARAAIAKAKP